MVLQGKPNSSSFSSFKTTRFTRKKRGSMELCKHTVGTKSCIYCSRKPKKSGVLFSYISNTEENRRLETHSGSKAAKQAYKSPSLQNGVPADSHPSSTKERLDVFIGSQGCLLSCSRPSFISSLFTFCGGSPPPAIYMPTLRAVYFAQDFLKSSSPSDCSIERRRNSYPALSRRYPSSSSVQTDVRTTQRQDDRISKEIWLGSQPSQESTCPNPATYFSRCRVSDPIRVGVVTTTEGGTAYSKDKPSSSQFMFVSQASLRSSRVYGFNNPTNKVGTLEHAAPPVGVVASVESQGSESADCSVALHEVQSSLVVQSTESAQLSLTGNTRLEYHNNRRKSIRLGCSLGRSCNTRKMGLCYCSSDLQYSGAEGGLASPISLPSGTEGSVGYASNGQSCSCSLYSKARGNSQLGAHERSISNHDISPETSNKFNSSVSSRTPECSSRSSVTSDYRQQRVVSKSGGLQYDSGEMGMPPSRPLCIQLQQQGKTFLFEVSDEECIGSRCPMPGMGLQPGLRIPPCPANPQISGEIEEDESSSFSSHPLLAQETMVSPPEVISPGTASAFALQDRSSSAERICSSKSTKTTTHGLEVERDRLLRSGCPQQVVSTLLAARKATTMSSYNRVWQKFAEFAKAQKFDPFQPKVGEILLFLDKGVKMGLAYSTLKGQVSALSAILGGSWAEEPMVRQFFKAILKIRPPRVPRFPKWDLPLVLKFLSTKPFFPLQDCSITNLTLKTAFLISIVSGRRMSELQALSSEEPFTVFFRDRVILYPVQAFIPKVSTAKHFNQEWALPEFKDPEDSVTLHPLDPVSTLKEYIQRTKSFRKTERLFVVTSGQRKGQAAAIRTIARWVVTVIQRAYRVLGLEIPQVISAHSTRGMSTSWAAYGQVSIETICKAANWATSNTFISHYKIEPGALSTVSFGKSVISSAVHSTV
ncbi:uncharacterized protein [Hyperolius riggenbachi]|uniref:uncharacterized protein isoform X1 n=1 Tax=Hyperolius riggenbachi TaxID=752182 RepID=UPI0035A38134